MKTIRYLVLLCLLSMSLSACNTTRGFGQDLKKLGSSIEDEANEEMND